MSTLSQRLLISTAGLILIFQTACTQPSPVLEKTNPVPREGATPVELTQQKIETCFTPAEACDEQLIHFINKSQKTLDIAIYSITHPAIAAAILDAQKRGVEIRMVADRVQAAGNSSLVDELLSAGIPLKIGNTGRAIMHHKFSIVDKRGLQTGSFNYTKGASFENSENQIYIYDRDVIERFQKDFDTLWSNGVQRAPVAASEDKPQN